MSNENPRILEKSVRPGGLVGSFCRVYIEREKKGKTKLRFKSKQTENSAFVMVAPATRRLSALGQGQINALQINIPIRKVNPPSTRDRCTIRCYI